MKNTIKLALLAAAVGVTAVATATPSDAHWTGHHRNSVRIYSDDGYGGYGAYASAAPYGYDSRYSWSASSRNERDCMRSPGSLAYVPCMNHQ